MKLTLRRTAASSVDPVPAPPKQAIPPVVKRNTIYFSAAQALQGSGMQLVVILGPLMIVRLLGSAMWAGLGVSVLGLSRMLVSYPMGKLTDTFGRKPGMFVGLALGLVGTVILSLSMFLMSFPVFLIGIVILGLGVGAAMQLRVAATDMYPPARRAEGLGYLFTGTMIGTLSGPVLISIGRRWADSMNSEPLAVSWLLAPVVLIPAMVLILLVRPDPKEIGNNLEKYWTSYKAPPSRPGPAAPIGGFLTFVRHYPKLVAFVCAAAAQGTMSMMMVMTALVLKAHNHALEAISVSITIHALGMFGLSIPLGRMTDRVGRKALLTGGVLLSAFGALMVPLTPNYWLITLATFMVGVGWSAINVASTALIADTTTPQERGRAIGANDTFGAAFNIVTPLIGGLIAARISLMAVGIVGAAFMIVPFVLLLRLREYGVGRYEDIKEATAAGA